MCFSWNTGLVRSKMREDVVSSRPGAALLRSAFPNTKSLAYVWLATSCPSKRVFLIDNLLVRIHLIIVMIRWTGLAPWGFESPFPGGLAFTFLAHHTTHGVCPLTQRSITLAHSLCLQSHLQTLTLINLVSITITTRLL